MIERLSVTFFTAHKFLSSLFLNGENKYFKTILYRQNTGFLYMHQQTWKNNDRSKITH